MEVKILKPYKKITAHHNSKIMGYSNYATIERSDEKQQSPKTNLKQSSQIPCINPKFLHLPKSNPLLMSYLVLELVAACPTHINPTAPAINNKLRHEIRTHRTRPRLFQLPPVMYLAASHHSCPWPSHPSDST